MSYKKALAITIILFLPLVALLPQQYSGDGVGYADSILKNDILLNPNHLLIQPISHLFNKLIGIPLNLHPLDTLKIISLISSFLTVLMFALLFQHYEFSKIPAYFSIAGFAYSACFLTLFDSSEILIVQMPVLLALFHLTIIFVKSEGKRMFNGVFNLALICSALVSIAMYISNVCIVIGIFAFLYILTKDHKIRSYIILSFLAVGFLSLATYYAVWNFWIPYKGGIGFLKWIASYRGSGNAEISSYGVPIQGYKDIIMRIARLYYGLSSNIVYVDLGPGFKSIISSKDSNSLSYGLGVILFWIMEIILMSAFVLSLCFRFVHILERRIELEKKLFLYLCIFIIVSIIPFNFYWNNTDDQFWIQILPAWWLAMAILMDPWPWDTSRSINLIRRTGWAIISLLIVNNLVFLLWPRHEFDSKKFAGQLADQIPANTTIIWPGHDRWDPVLYLSKQKASRGGKLVEFVELLSYANPEEFYNDIGKKMNEGKSVYLLRVLDADEESTPWDSLNEKGFYRSELSTIIGRKYKISKKNIIYGHTAFVMITE